MKYKPRGNSQFHHPPPIPYLSSIFLAPNLELKFKPTSYTPFTLQAVSPVVGCVRMRPYDTMVKCPCVSYISFVRFKISASEFGTIGMRRRKQACTDQFLATVTEGVVHGVYKLVTKSSFSLIWRHKVSQSKWIFCHCITRLGTNLGWYKPRTTAGHTTCSVNATPNIGRYVASLEAVPLPQKTSNRGACHL